MYEIEATKMSHNYLLFHTAIHSFKLLPSLFQYASFLKFLEFKVYMHVQ